MLYRKPHSSYYYPSNDDDYSGESDSMNDQDYRFDAASSGRSVQMLSKSLKTTQTGDPMMRSLTPLKRYKRSANLKEDELMAEEASLVSGSEPLEIESNETVNYSATVFERSSRRGSSSANKYVLRTCGKSTKLAQRVVNGEDAEDGKYPWVVAILKFGDGWCGGAILNKWWVITASHCFMSWVKSYFVLV